MIRAAWVCALLLVGACFDQPEPAASTSEGGDDGATCSVGALGCACAEGSVCLEGLTCEPSVQRCVQDGCTPGTELCTCNAGACLTGLECTDGLCRVPTPTDTTGAMSASGSEGGPPPPTSTDPTMDPTMDPTATDTTASGEVDVDDGPVAQCDACRTCVEMALGAACMPANNTCSASGACLELMTATTMCCDESCVTNKCRASGLRIFDYDVLAQCLDAACAGQCEFGFGC